MSALGSAEATSPADDALARVTALSGQNVYACYQCGRCTAACPFGFEPQRLVRHLQLGQVDRALALETVWACAQCFACTAACPKGVDLARLVRALREMSPDQHGPCQRVALFANINRLSRVGSRLAPLANRLLRLPGGRLFAHYVLGVHRARSFPPFARPAFPHWFGTHPRQGDGHRGKVLLFHDTFMDYNHPETGVAATEVLELAGFEVELAGNVCCGRPMISKWLLGKARAQARENVERLYPGAAEGFPIVGCEPSCLLTLRSEYPELLRGSALEQKARTVAAQAVLLDELLAPLAEQGELDLSFDPRGSPVLFHAHCQQKAFARPEASLELLRLAGYDAELVNTTCCGMAGAFGYEKEHYQLSRAQGERELAPAVRAHPEAEVVICGMSCRHQIEDLTGRHPRHLAEALRDAIKQTGS